MMTTIDHLFGETPLHEPVGTLDFATPVEHMQAVDAAMRIYFGTSDWIRERNLLFPGFRSR
jgi:hypothetical protein